MLVSQSPLSLRSSRKNIKRYTTVLLSLWTILVLGLGVWNANRINEMVNSIAIKHARAQIKKNLSFRHWYVSHGGIYIPVNSINLPNPYLANIKEHSATTASGTALILISPDEMLQQLDTHPGGISDVSGHLTSLEPLRPENMPDPWEEKALISFKEGNTEQLQVFHKGARSYLRLMQPLTTTVECLMCHSHQTYKEGEFNGGMSVTLPMDHTVTEGNSTLLHQSLSLLFLWFLGLISHLVGSKVILHYDSLYQKGLQTAKDQEERLELIISGAHLGTWDWDIVHDEVFFNERWADILGYTLKDITKTSAAWQKRLHPEEKKWVRQELFAHLNGKTPAYVCEHRLRHKSNKWVWILEVGQVLEWGEDGSPTRAAGIMLDLSEQKEAEWAQIKAKEEAESANKSKSVFLANMSHELRTPLNGIMGYTQIFKEDKRLDSGQQEGIRVIHESAEHLLQIITDILDLSKIEAGRLELVTTEYFLSDLLQQVADIIQIRSAEKGLIFSFELAADLPQVVIGDELRLRQVLLNLLANSVKFTEHGKVTLKASRVKTVSSKRDKLACVAISVEDTGPGISEENQQRIFEPFQQTGDRLLYAEGSGLGLSISRKLVHMMGGSLSLISPLPSRHDSGDYGPGSSFTVNLTFHEMAGLKTEIVQKNDIIGYRVNGKTCTTQKVLIVDDNTINRLVWSEILKNVGFQITEAKTGGEVLDTCLRFRPDAVLMDLKMTPVDGYEATTLLRRYGDFNDLAIIAVSALADFKGDLKDSCKKAGFSDYMAKPVIKSALLQKIAKLLNLELIYQNDQENVKPSTEQSDLVLPEQHHIQAILDFVLIGDLENINLEMAKLEQEDGRYLPFLTLLRKMSDNFQFDALENALNDYIKESQHV